MSLQVVNVVLEIGWLDVIRLEMIGVLCAKGIFDF